MWSFVAALAKGLFDSVLGLITGQMQRSSDKLQGMNEQRQADDRATTKQAEQAAKASGQIAGESDDQVRQDLANDFRPGA